MKKIILFLIFLSLLISVFFLFKGINNGNVLYSWNMNNILDDKFVKVVDKLNIDVVYQAFSSDYLNEKDNKFLKKMFDNKIDVFHLTGDPSWGEDSSCNSLIKQIDKVSLYNYNNSYKISGIVFDIEPYVDEKLKNEEFDFETYVFIMNKTYEYIKNKNLKMIIVIPFWFDNKDKVLLKKLIMNSDGISVMNYNINNTISNIQNEVELAEKHNKYIDTIYEINMLNKGYFKSFYDIDKDYSNIYDKYNYSGLKKAYHHYKSIVEKSTLFD